MLGRYGTLNHHRSRKHGTRQFRSDERLVLEISVPLCANIGETTLSFFKVEGLEKNNVRICFKKD